MTKIIIVLLVWAILDIIYRYRTGKKITELKTNFRTCVMHINELETVHNNLVDDMNEKFKNFEEKIKEKVEIKKEDEPGSPEEFNIMEVLSE